jgi:hypothetical protein
MGSLIARNKEEKRKKAPLVFYLYLALPLPEHSHHRGMQNTYKLLLFLFLPAFF